MLSVQACLDIWNSRYRNKIDFGALRIFISEVKSCLIETMKDVIMVYNRTKKEGFLPVNIKKTSNVAGEIGIKASSGKGFNVTGILSEVTGMKKVTIARISDKKGQNDKQTSQS